MQCPIDGSQLVMSERSGVEIDYCPKCRGVWLDRGELDKIIERSSASVSQDRSSDHRSHEPRRDSRSSDSRYTEKRKRRGSFLEDLFDFD